MSEPIDAGAILKQVQISIDKDDTALSLNLKCCKTAFTVLLNELLTNTYTLHQQQVDSATYCYLYRKPVGNALINWAQQTAEEGERVYRATQLGDHTNFSPCCALKR